MVSQKRSSALLWFYVLVSYIFLQFGWWAYLMLDLNKEITRAKTEITLFKSSSVEEAHKAEVELNQDMNKKRIMVIGEGTVFIILLLLGVTRVRNSFKKEAELARQQNNFLLSITHELKSPMASNRLQLETLLMRDLEREKQKEILKNAIKDVDRLNALVDNILLTARLDQSQFKLNKEKTNITELLTGILASKNVKTDLDKDVFAVVDSMYFTSIVLNLVENAFKYSSDGEQVLVTLKKLGSGISLSIADNGIGIHDTQKQHIFEKFYRIGKEETRNTKGTGLGLYIVKNLVELHKGRITVTDNIPKGTIFTVNFP